MSVSLAECTPCLEAAAVDGWVVVALLLGSGGTHGLHMLLRWRRRIARLADTLDRLPDVTNDDEPTDDAPTETRRRREAPRA